MVRPASRILGLGLGLFLVAPAFAQPTPLPLPPARSATAPTISQGDHLIRAFGGQEGLRTMTADFMRRVLADERIAIFFVGFDHAKIEGHLYHQFCQILNGGCVYTGRDMNIHAHMGITEADFYALVEDLQAAMEAHKVPNWAQNKLLAALAPQARDVISRPVEVVAPKH